MILIKTWRRHKHGSIPFETHLWEYRGWFLFGFIPLLIIREKIG